MKNFVTIIIVVIITGSVVWAFIFLGRSKSAVKSGLVAELPAGPGSKDTETLSRELLSALSSLKDLKLDDKFFNDQAFLSLKDDSKGLVDELLGRENPFLPVGAVDENQVVQLPPVKLPR